MNTRRPASEKTSTEGEPSPNAPWARPEGEEGPTVDPVSLSVVPVDPHRVFVRWRVSPEGLDLAGLNREAAESRLALRFFRGGKTTDEFPAESGMHEGFFSLGQPGGTVAAGLVVRSTGQEFDLLTMAPPVRLPEPVATLSESPKRRTIVPPPRLPVRAEAPTSAAPETQAEPGATSVAPPKSAPVLDEARILAAAARIASLPPELRRVHPAPTEPETTPRDNEARQETDTVRQETFISAWSQLPKTPILEEHRVVQGILREEHALNEFASSAHEGSGETGAPDPVSPSEDAAQATAAGSSNRLASHFDPDFDGAPMTLETTLRMSGRVAPHFRLRLGHAEVALRADGSFYHQQRITSFATAWMLLQDMVSMESEDAGPTLELLTALPEAEAALALHSTIEITGVLRDQTYRHLLPDGLDIDAAGCFRLVRSLPVGAIVLPHLVLVPSGPAR